MPVKLGSKQPGETEARIEIIPLIDIMFFLLASFMLLSLSLTRLQSVKVNLPTATSATKENKPDLLHLSVDRDGLAYVDRQPVGGGELAQRLAAARKLHPDLRVLISGDLTARHGDVLRVLDVARSAGIEKVAFEIRSGPAAATPTP